MDISPVYEVRPYEDGYCVVLGEKVVLSVIMDINDAVEVCESLNRGLE